MAQDLAVGDTVYVPCARFGLSEQPLALYELRVEQVHGRSVEVSLPAGQPSRCIAASLVHKNIGIAVLRIGDFVNELALLDPLAKSIFQYCRLLLHDSMVKLQDVRSLAELSRWWAANHRAFSHIVIIGHGQSNGIRFAVDDWVGAQSLGAHLPCPATQRKVLLSLCCHTGYAEFGQTASQEDMCSAFVGPFHSVHGAIASQFCQTFLAYQLLEGETPAVAFRHARNAVPGSTSFRFWQKGRLKAGPKP
jgi:hypothetical protein